MNKIYQLITSKFADVKRIDGTHLPNSGTGYIYPSFCDEVVTQFTERGRLGYLIQFSIHDTETQEVKKSCFVVHERYTGSSNPVVYSGPNEFYYNCVIDSRDMDIFTERLKKLLDGELVDGWYNDKTDVLEWNSSINIHVQFKLGKEGNDKFQRPMLMCIGADC